MIESLNRAEALYNNNPIVEHLKGIVYYQSDKINEAKHYFSISAGSSNANVNNKSKEMLALCYIKEDNIPEAEKTVSGLESAGASVMSLIYLRIFSKYAAKGTDDSQNVEKSIMYAQKYVDRRAGDKNEPSAQGISAYAFLGEMYREGSDSLKYYAANDLLAYAADHGNGQAKNILKRYGVEGVIVKRGNVKDIPVKFPNGYVITVDAKYLYALLVEKLRRDPRNIDTFKSILKLSLDSGNASAESIENLVKYAQLFRFDISEYNLTQNS